MSVCSLRVGAESFLGEVGGVERSWPSLTGAEVSGGQKSIRRGSLEMVFN